MPTDRPCFFGGRKKKPLIKPLSGQTPQNSTSTVVQTQSVAYTQVSNNQSFAVEREKSLPRSTSLKGLLKAKDEKKENNTTQLQESNLAFSQDDLQKYWTEYANTLDIKKIHLKNTLLNCKPKLEKDFSFEAGVYNPTQKDEISENAAVIINYLISKLNNSHIKMTIRVLEQDVKEMIYTTTEKYNYLKNKNPDLEKLMEAFELVPE